MRIFPKGCKIVDIKRGQGARSCFVYAKLEAPNGAILINATLDYIQKQLENAEFRDDLPEDY